MTTRPQVARPQSTVTRVDAVSETGTPSQVGAVVLFQFMIEYEVRSKANAFKSFRLEDNGLGYLTFNIYQKIAEIAYGPLGAIIGIPREYPDSDIMVRKVGTKRWKKIHYKTNSSVSYLK